MGIRLTIWRCGTCRHTYANPFTHTCVVQMDRKTPPGRTRLAVAVKAERACPVCHQPRGLLDLTHTCTVKTDFKQRRRAADREAGKRERAEKRRRAKAARQARRRPPRKTAEPAAKPRPAPKPRNRHDYATCDDLDCTLFPCRVHREGQAKGEVIGEARGHAEGYAEGYTEGIANCPLPHA
jgi:hypothetical protein